MHFLIRPCLGRHLDRLMLKIKKTAHIFHKQVVSTIQKWWVYCGFVLIVAQFHPLWLAHIVRLVNDPGLWLAKVNPNGETYPVGLFVSSYAASYAAQYLGSILIQALKRHAWILGC